MQNWLNYIIYVHPPVLLMIGDLSNLAGAVWLAADLIWKEHEIRKHWIYLSVLTRRHEFPIEVEGKRIEKAEDVDLVFARRKSRSAKYACALLILGFTLLTIGHWIEVHHL